MADHKMTKSVGEHWTCSELARRGWAPALTRDGIARTDILAVGTHIEHRPRVEVQVKSATQKGQLHEVNWQLGGLVLQLAQSEAEWVVLVSIPVDRKQPLVGYVVPRDHVAAATHMDHTRYIFEGNGSRKPYMKMARVWSGVFEGYRARWDLLEHPTTDCPVLLPQEFEQLAQNEHIGLPDGHPWLEDFPVWGE